MMRSVLAKEIRGLLPFVWLFIFLTVAGYSSVLVTESFTLESIKESYGDGLIYLDFSITIVYFILAMAISYGLLVREVDDQTIEFFDSLPISRTQWFACKWIAAMGVLTLLPVLDAAAMVGFRRFAGDSLDRSLHLDWVATSMFLQWIQLFCFFGIGLTLSFFRRFGWLMLGLAGWAMMILGKFYPSLDLFSLPLFADVQFSGTRWIIPWSKVAAFVVVGCAGSAVAIGLFCQAGRRSSWLLANMDSRVRQLVLIGTSIAIGFVFFGAILFATAQSTDLDEDPNAVRVVYPSWSTATRTTKHFSAVYPTNLSGRATELLEQADPTYQKVAEFFNYADDSVVQLDLTTATSHLAGNANWNSIKMTLATDVDRSPLVPTLGHEMTHVVLESLSDGQLRNHFDSTRFFHEGVATYIERSLFLEKGLVQQRTGAAVLAARKQASLDRLMDNDTLRRKYDSLVVYELGEVFAAAVVDKFGKEALGNLARAFVERRNSEGLSGVALWRSIFQAAGYSLSSASDRYYQLLDEAKVRHADLIEQMPPVYPVVDFLDDQVVQFSTDVDPPEGYKMVIRFRSSIESRDDQYWRARFDASGTAVTMASLFSGPAIWYQVGYQSETDLPIFQPWEKAVAR